MFVMVLWGGCYVALPLVQVVRSRPRISIETPAMTATVAVVALVWGYPVLWVISRTATGGGLVLICLTILGHWVCVFHMSL